MSKPNSLTFISAISPLTLPLAATALVAMTGCQPPEKVTQEAGVIEGDVAEAIQDNVELADGKQHGGSSATGPADSKNTHDDTRHAQKAAGAEDDPERSKNLCKAFDSCDGCIDGLQSEGVSEKSAKARCGLAVTGCWVTWDKPVRCGDDQYDERPS